jgi:hypothetical protein
VLLHTSWKLGASSKLFSAVKGWLAESRRTSLGSGEGLDGGQQWYTTHRLSHKELLGKIQATDCPTRVDRVCITQPPPPPPPPQQRFNPRTNKTELFKPDGTLYTPNEPRKRMKSGTKWTEEQTIPTLYASGVLRETGGSWRGQSGRDMR